MFHNLLNDYQKFIKNLLNIIDFIFVSASRR